MTITIHGQPIRIESIEPFIAERLQAEAKLGRIFAKFDGTNPAPLRPFEREIVALQELIVDRSAVEQAWYEALERNNDRIKDENILAVWRAYRSWKAEDAAAGYDGGVDDDPTKDRR